MDGIPPNRREAAGDDFQLVVLEAWAVGIPVGYQAQNHYFSGGDGSRLFIRMLF